MSHANLPIAVHAILLEDNKILLLHRKNTGFNDGQWSVPAGRLESGETITLGVVREAEEEVGVKINPINFESVLIMHHHDERGERMYAFLLCKKWEGEPVNCEPDKCGKIAWFEIDNLPENTLSHIKVAIDAVIKGESYLEFGF